eukprot:4198562-Amphidinium_carterae.2
MWMVHREDGDADDEMAPSATNGYCAILVCKLWSDLVAKLRSTSMMPFYEKHWLHLGLRLTDFGRITPFGVGKVTDHLTVHCPPMDLQSDQSFHQQKNVLWLWVVVAFGLAARLDKGNLGTKVPKNEDILRRAVQQPPNGSDPQIQTEFCPLRPGVSDFAIAQC